MLLPAEPQKAHRALLWAASVYSQIAALTTWMPSGLHCETVCEQSGDSWATILSCW